MFLKNSTYLNTKSFLPIIISLFFILIPRSSFTQTTLSPGDIAITNFRTSGATDAVTLLVLKELDCGTQFIITDNNWRTSTTAWYCTNDEFAIGFTTTSIITAGTTIYIEVNPIGNLSILPYGTATYTSLGNPWGTNTGFNSGGDNCFVLQGTYASPSFIYGFRHNGTFASGGDCTSKDNTGLPPGLTLGSTAIQMPSSQNYWQYNCGVLNSGTAAALLASISNNANWTTSAGACSYTITNASYNPTGALGVSGAGCGCLASCNETTSGGPNCGAGVAGNCTAGEQNVSVDIIVPVGCIYYVTATMRTWTGCSAAGADAGDKLKVDLPAGVKPFQTGASNAELDDAYTLTGPGTIRVSGSADRADEIIVYRIITSPCATCGLFILPIELTQFSASLEDNKSAKLSWTTATEFQNDFFTIERSFNATDWEIISVVNSFGDSKSNTSYSIFDRSPLPGVSYYRLKQSDKDGTSTYSQIVYLDNSINDEGRKIIKRVNIYGQEVDENAFGLIILVYENGEMKKIIK